MSPIYFSNPRVNRPRSIPGNAVYEIEQFGLEHWSLRRFIIPSRGQHPPRPNVHQKRFAEGVNNRRQNGRSRILLKGRAANPKATISIFNPIAGSAAEVADCMPLPSAKHQSKGKRVRRAI